MNAVANSAAFIGTFRMCSNVHYVSLINVRHQSSRDRSVPKSPISIAVWTAGTNIVYNNLEIYCPPASQQTVHAKTYILVWGAVKILNDLL